MGEGIIASYVHSSVDEGLGKIGVIVAFESTGTSERLARFGRMVAMHVAASNPQALDPAGLDPDAVRREREVLADKAKAQGKPAHVIEKIVESGLKTFYKEVCLLDQAFIHEPDKSVAQAVKQAEAESGEISTLAPISISASCTKKATPSSARASRPSRKPRTSRDITRSSTAVCPKR